MDEDGEIDAVRYPTFAQLAGDGTWFRNATTVHEHTTEAVPSIMTGREPEAGRLPLLSDHPNNVFTFLGGSYAMNVLEPVTQLCPTNLCPRPRDSFAERMNSLREDLAVVYGHVVLPDGISNRLPSVMETWQGFGKAHAEEDLAAEPLAVRNEADIDHAVGLELWQDQRFQMERYAASLEATDEPTLFVVHAMLPHSPWRFLPSGRQYGDALGIDGIADDRWGDDEWLVEQGRQRHLLQTGATDRLLGELLARLKRTGLYEKSLVIVTADHGVSFKPGDHRRGVTATNLGDIAAGAAHRQASRRDLGRDRRSQRADDRHPPDDRRRARRAAPLRRRRALALRSLERPRRGVSAPARRRRGGRLRGRGHARPRRDGGAAGARSSARGTRRASTPSGRTPRSWARRRRSSPPPTPAGSRRRSTESPSCARSISTPRSCPRTCRAASTGTARGRRCGSSSP